ncbi:MULTISPECIES: ribonuclease P protein component [Pseudanabaena]|uniref:Ribonuclease P protein component n=2 Tax=Pseudanabaena TaxID=1152 RepID=L8MZ02_9CYAN|nr:MULTISPECIES: ribonuclease P protein component [Pseudanabaena]ELS33212.1 ribonuclease P protein component [Pseudanabaena biceps PCC 7429]MDG3494596.1 ribonuclease P protein component [Pseudanabaena catenata USMAC16]TYQ31875.1 ribonuclease P protein component [Pseudanabaena sp. UWO310]
MLPNQNRLRRREDFAKVYANGDRYRGTYLNLRILFDSNIPLTRIGIVVSKKVSKLAVTRNRFKRQLRAIFRQLLSQLRCGLQIVVTVTTVQSKPSYQELWDDLKNLLARAKVLHGS